MLRYACGSVSIGRSPPPPRPDLEDMEISLEDVDDVIVLTRLYHPREVQEDVHTRANEVTGVGQGARLPKPTRTTP